MDVEVNSIAEAIAFENLEGKALAIELNNSIDTFTQIVDGDGVLQTTLILKDEPEPLTVTQHKRRLRIHLLFAKNQLADLLALL